MPPSAVTATSPVAPELRIAVICVGETSVNRAAGAPPKLTALAWVKFAPIIVTAMPAPAPRGVKPETTGGAMKRNPASSIVPLEAVILTLPLELPAATTAVACVSEIRTKEAASTPPKRTSLNPAKFTPVIAMTVPELARVGENDVMRGGASKLKPFLLAVPPSVSTVIVPPVVPCGTLARISVGETTTTFGERTPPKLTCAVVVKLMPVMVIMFVGAATIGIKPSITGESTKTKPGSESVPIGVRTNTAPLLAPSETIALMRVSETTSWRRAIIPPKRTSEASVKFAPVIVTMPRRPDIVGVKLRIVGATAKVNPEREPEPPSAVTRTSPVAPVASVAVMRFARTLKDAAETPPKLTALTLIKFSPSITTVCPAPARDGAKASTCAGGRNAKPPNSAVPVCVITCTEPVEAVVINASNSVGEKTVNRAADTPPKRTSRTPTKFAPLTKIRIPLPAVVGLKPCTLGGGATKLNICVETPAPPALTTETVPFELFAPITAVMTESDTIVKLPAAKPPKRTERTAAKLRPTMRTVVPTSPVCGEMLATTGVETKTIPVLEATPPSVATVTRPVAPLPTTASILVCESAETLAAVTPPNQTFCTVLRFVPEITTRRPSPDSRGETSVMVGSGTNV